MYIYLLTSLGPVLVLDEVHHIKNYTSRAYAAIRKLRERLDTYIVMSDTQLDNTRMDGYAALSLLRGHDIGYVTVSARTEGSTADGNEVFDEWSDRSLNLEFFAQKKAILCRHDR